MAASALTALQDPHAKSAPAPSQVTTTGTQKRPRTRCVITSVPTAAPDANTPNTKSPPPRYRTAAAAASNAPTCAATARTTPAAGISAVSSRKTKPHRSSA
ncbi:hypothetical protein JCM33774_39990 [Actinophytocola sp. KF-1]